MQLYHKRLLILFILLFILQSFTSSLLAQMSYNLYGCSATNQFSAPYHSRPMLFKNAESPFSRKENNCIKTGQILGIAAGSFMGTMTMYWKATGESGVHGPFWKSVVTAIPSILVGSYVGSKTSEWATKRMIKGHPNVAMALLKGAGYGALQGAVIFTASLVPLFIVGHYLGTYQKISPKVWG